MTRRLPRRALALCAGGMLLLSSHPSAALAEPADPPSAGGAWQTPTSARLSSDGSLSDVVGLSASSAWAVGQQSVWDIWQSRGAIAHWDGSAWSEVGVRNDPTGAGVLRSIAAGSPTELWAVGEGHDGLPYVARGDGTGFDRFAVDELRVGDWLGGVAAGGGRMVSVGRRGKDPMILTVTSAKRKVTKLKGEGTLYGVALSGKDDGWAVGDDGDGPLLARLSDGRWKTVKAPRVPDGYLRDIHIDGPKRALAVGGVYRGESGEAGPLVLSWNGKKWSRVRVRGDRMNLYGVTGDRKGHFWISGVDLKRPGEAFLLRYDGRTLKSVHGAPAEARRTVRLQSVAYLPKDGGVLAVGHVVDPKGRYTDVIERFGAPERAKS